MVLTSPIAGRAKFHFSKINVGSVMSVMFVDIRPGALGSPESTEVHDLRQCNITLSDNYSPLCY